MSPVDTLVLGVDEGSRRRDDAEHLLRRAVDTVLALDGTRVPLACTHLVRRPEPHWAVTLEVDPGPVPAPALRDRLAGLGAVCLAAPGRAAPTGGGEQEAVAQFLDGGGRVVVFPGQDALEDVVSVDDVPELCAVERVVGIAGTPVDGRLLHTRGWVRPEREDGRLVLHVRPFGPAGDVAPFEVRDPTPCCAAHG